MVLLTIRCQNGSWVLDSPRWVSVAVFLGTTVQSMGCDLAKLMFAVLDLSLAPGRIFIKI